MEKEQIKQTISEFVQAIKENNKPKAWNLMNKVIEAKLDAQLEEKTQKILESKKF